MMTSFDTFDKQIKIEQTENNIKSNKIFHIF